MRFHQWFLEVAVLIIALVLFCLSKPTDKRGVLLPPSLQPEHYDLSIAPRLDQGIFRSVLVLSGVAVADTDRIVLHCKNLIFNHTSLKDLTTDEDLEVENIEEDLLLQQCHILLNQSLRVDHEYRLRIEYVGLIGSEGVGLYRDYYTQGRVRHEILMTNVQPNFARAVLPCFDEPHYKAQFLLRVAKHGFPTVISNMPIASVSPPDSDQDNCTWVELEETPPMSTYQLVVVLCDYLALSDSTTNSSVWAPRSRLHEAQLALNVSVSALEQCEWYFSTEYPLPKLDHVPVPSLNTVAMENWGAITYKKDFLLWEEGVSTWAQREMISHVVTHEVIHQWIGNLVTTTWWNTTWLNEGVASFYHYYIMDKIEPSWNAMDNTFVTQIQQILTEETTRDPKPLTNNEPLPEDAIFSQAFSASTYLKGAAIIRMVFNLMAPDIFREAIVQYIIDNEYGSVDEEDLWQSIAVVADLPVDLESVMYSWTHQPGYPLVTVFRGEDGCISVKQEKYLAKDESDARWTIPLTYTTSSEIDFNISNTVWFEENDEEVELGECLEPSDWIIVNIRQAGFYRVNYDTATWTALAHDLVHCDLSDIHPVNRAQLLGDGFSLARHGLLGYPMVLRLAQYLRRETQYLPWATGIQALQALRAQLRHTEAYKPFQMYTLDLVEGVFSALNLKGNAGGLLPELHRKQMVEFACSLRHPRCVKEATEAAYLLMSGVEVSIPLDLKPLLLCAAVRHGQGEVWHYVLKEYLGAAENERWKYLVALACSSDKKTVRRLLRDVADPKSFVKGSEERLNLLLELGRQEDTLESILDMILSDFTNLAAKLDFEVILHLLRSFMPPKVTPEEKRKLSEVAVLVGKTQSIKQKEMIDFIIADIDRPDFKFQYQNDITQWLSREIKVEKESLTPRPNPWTKDMNRPTSKTDKEGKRIVNHPVGESDEKTRSNGIGEEGWGEKDEVHVTKPHYTKPVEGAHSSSSRTFSVFSFVLFVIMFHVMR